MVVEGYSVTRPSNDGQYLNGVSGKYFGQLNTYDDVKREVTVVKIFASRRLYSVVLLRNKKLRQMWSILDSFDLEYGASKKTTYTRRILQMRAQCP